MPEVSVIICTLNRLEYLRKALKSLIEQTAPASYFEVVVVDNGSTDGTAAYVQEQSKQHSFIKYLFEPKVGLSNARNSGSMVATGRYLAFLDDDAIASRQWVQNIINVFNTGELEIGCAGGKIELIWEVSRPVWLHDGLLSQLGKLDLYGHALILPPGKYLFGGNFSIRKDVLEAVGSFSSFLGRQGDKLISNEEIELQTRLSFAGIPIVYDPKILVFHHAKAECISKKWYLRRRFWQGYSETESMVRVACGHLAYLKNVASIVTLSLCGILLSFFSGLFFNVLLEVCYNLGKIYAVIHVKRLQSCASV